MKGKYVVRETILGEHPLLFPDSVRHDSIITYRVISAGFFKLRQNGFYCYGESESLGILSRGQQDADLMNVFFYLEQ